MLARPGIVQMVLAAFETQKLDPGTESAQAAGYRLMDAFEQSSRPPRRPAPHPLWRCGLIVTAAMSQQSPLDADLHVPEEEFVPLVRDLALGVLGARPPSPPGGVSPPPIPGLMTCTDITSTNHPAVGTHGPRGRAPGVPNVTVRSKGGRSTSRTWGSAQ